METEWLESVTRRNDEEEQWLMPECETCKHLRDCQPDENYAEGCQEYKEETTS